MISMQGRGSSYLPLYIGHPEIGVDKTRRGKNSNRAEKVKREADTIRTEQHLPKKGRRKIEVRKRMLAVLLSIVMVLGMLPVTASAGAADGNKTVMFGPLALEAGYNTADAATVYLGKDETGKPISWRIFRYTSGNCNHGCNQ